MLYVGHPATDKINEAREITDVLLFEKKKMWFIDYDTEWRRQELEEQLIINIINNRFSLKQHIKISWTVIGLYIRA